MTCHSCGAKIKDGWFVLATVAQVVDGLLGNGPEDYHCEIELCESCKRRLDDLLGELVRRSTPKESEK